jgi:type II secretory pathway pseudopilin PulG
MLRLTSVLKSSRAAIDLASIMVGVIIIGLIGGVIAATVFAVIPWSQDKAAKQQLDSVHTAQNAFFGLSSDPSQDLVGGKKNSFANSVELGLNSLLASNPTYCTVATVDGKDYHAYAKSGSGKWFYALNSNKQAQVLTAGVVPCVEAVVDTKPVVIVDPSVDNGSTPVGTAPTDSGTGAPGSGSTTPGGGTSPVVTPAPVYTPVSTWDFEKANNQSFYDWSGRQSNSYKHGGSYSLYGDTDTVIKNVSISNYYSSYVVGQKYRMTAWVYTDPSYYTAKDMKISVAGKTSNLVSDTQKWVQLSVEYTATAKSMTASFSAQGAAVNRTPQFFIDDVVLEKIS